MGTTQSKSARCYNLVIKKDWDGVRDFFLSESQQQSDPKEQVKEASVSASASSDNKDGDDTNADDEWCVDAYVHGYGYTMLENEHEHEHDVMHVDADSTSAEHDDENDLFMNNILYQNEEDGNTTLIQAIRHEAPIDIIASLIDKGGNDLVLMKDNYGQTAVYHTCCYYMNLVCYPTNELKMKETMKLLFNVNHASSSSRSSINGEGGGELKLALTGIDQDGFSELDNLLACWDVAADGRAVTIATPIVTNAIICQFRTLLELSSGSTIVSTTSTCAPKHTHNRHSTHSGESGDDNANANANANALTLKLTVPMLKRFVQLQQQPSCEYKNGDECEHSQSQSQSDVFFTMTDKEGRTLMQLMAANHPSANVIGYVFKEGLVKKGETKYRQNYNHTNIRSEWTALLERAILDDHGVYVESQLEQSKKSDDDADTHHADVDQHELQSCYGHLWDLVDGEYWEAVRIFMTSTNIAKETEIRKKNVFYQSKKLRKKHIYVNDEKCKKPKHYVLDNKYGDEEDTPLHLAAKRLAPPDIFQKLLDVGGRELALLHNRDCKTAYELVCENQNQNQNHDQNQQDEVNNAGAAPRQIMQLLQDFMFPLKNAKKCPPLSKPNMNIQVGDRDSKQCLANGEEWIDMIPPDNITRSVVEGALELALQVARYGVGEGMRANKGFMVLIRPTSTSASTSASASEGADVIITGADYVVDIGYCDEGNNNMFKGKQIDVRKWRDFEDVIMPSFLKDGAICIDGATGMIDTDGFMIDLSTRGAHPGGGPVYRQASAAGAKGYIAIKWSEDDIYCSTDGIRKHELKVFAGTKEPTFVPVKHCMHM